MVQQVTKGIKISVDTNFEGTFFRNEKMLFAFAYHITIENTCKDTVQLQTRKWIIYDALNKIETVTGEGVIGLKPILKPGELHHYSSGSVLRSPYGAMFGNYNMKNLNNGENFLVHIPNFQLSADFVLN